MGHAETLGEIYQALYRLVVRQRRALESENLLRLEELTKEKEVYIKRLAEMEEETNILKHEAENRALKPIRDKLVKEDRAFIERLREKEKGLIRKVKEIGDTKKNLNSIGSAYAKKFTGPTKYLDETC